MRALDAVCTCLRPGRGGIDNTRHDATRPPGRYLQPGHLWLCPRLPGRIGRRRARNPAEAPQRAGHPRRPYLLRRGVGPEPGPPWMGASPVRRPPWGHHHRHQTRPGCPEPGRGVRAIAELHNEGIGLRTIAEGLDTGDDSQAHLFLVLAELVPRAAAEGRHPGTPAGRLCLPRSRPRPSATSWLSTTATYQQRPAPLIRAAGQSIVSETGHTLPCGAQAIVLGRRQCHSRPSSRGQVPVKGVDARCGDPGRG